MKLFHFLKFFNFFIQIIFGRHYASRDSFIALVTITSHWSIICDRLKRQSNQWLNGPKISWLSMLLHRDVVWNTLCCNLLTSEANISLPAILCLDVSAAVSCSRSNEQTNWIFLIFMYFMVELIELNFLYFVAGIRSWFLAADCLRIGRVARRPSLSSTAGLPPSWRWSTMSSTLSHSPTALGPAVTIYFHFSWGLSR